MFDLTGKFDYDRPIVIYFPELFPTRLRGTGNHSAITSDASSPPSVLLLSVYSRAGSMRTSLSPCVTPE